MCFVFFSQFSFSLHLISYADGTRSPYPHSGNANCISATCAKRDDSLWPSGATSSLLESNSSRDDGREDDIIHISVGVDNGGDDSGTGGVDSGTDGTGDLSQPDFNLDFTDIYENDKSPQKSGTSRSTPSTPTTKMVNYQEYAILEACSPIQMSSVLAIASSLEVT